MGLALTPSSMLYTDCKDTARDDGHTCYIIAINLHDDTHLLLVDHPRVVRVVQLEAPQQLLLNCPVCVQWLLIACLE